MIALRGASRKQRPPQHVIDLVDEAAANDHAPDVAARLIALALDEVPSSSYLLRAYGSLQFRLGHPDLALDSFERALAINPREEHLIHDMILAYDQVPGATWEGAFRLRQLWAACFGLTPQRIPIRDPDPERPIRVGFSSPDFYLHSAAYCFAGPIFHHSDGMEVYCYADVRPENEAKGWIEVGTGDGGERSRLNIVDAFRKRTHWRDTQRLSGKEWRRVIADDRIDILIDCAGFTPDGRLRDFSRRGAHLQFCGWGYATGTGLPAMDYFLADPIAMPPEVRQWFSETVVDLPAVIGYYPPAHPDPVGPLPALQPGAPFTFASFNRVSKLNRPTFVMWAQILAAVPHGRLVLKGGGFDTTPGFTEWMLSQFAGLGIDPARILVEGGSPHLEHLARFNLVDLSLDPHPHAGGVSSADSLFMGTPVVTLLGDVSTSRLSASIMRGLGIEGFVARTPDEYVRIAVDWTTRLEELNAIRLGLRDRFLRSAIWGPSYGAHVEQALREVWRARCKEEVS